MRRDASNILSEIKLDAASSEQLHLQLLNQIQGRIQASQLLPGERLPTNSEIASHLHVSYETVHRAMKSLADLGVVVRRKSKGTFVREAVVAQEVGIFCTESVFDPQASPFPSLMAHHLSQQLHGNGRDMHVYYIPQPWSNKAKTYRGLRRDLMERRLAGIITLNRMPKELVDLAGQMSIPLVGVVAPDAMPCTVWIDHADFCRRAVQRMVQEGCRRVLLLGFSIKKEELLEAAAAGGIKLMVDDVITVSLPDAASTIGEEMGRTIDLTSYDGVVIGDDILAVGFARGLRQRRIRVPEDLKLATMWNRGSPLSLALPAARFELSSETLTKRCIQLLDELIESGQNTRPHVSVQMEDPAEPVNANSIHVQQHS